MTDMKRFLAFIAMVALALALPVSADQSDDEFVQIFNLIQQADTLKDSGQGRAALQRYQQAQDALKKFAVDHANWNPRLVKYRLTYLDDQIKPLAGQFPALPTPPPIQEKKDAKPEGKTPPDSGLERQIRLLNEELVRLQADRLQMEAKLKEALAAKPRDADPAEFAKAQEEIRSLRKDLDLQKVNAEQGQKSVTQLSRDKESLEKKVQNLTDKSEMATLRSELAAARASSENLSKQNKKLEGLLTDVQSKPSSQSRQTDEQLKAAQKTIQSQESRIAELQKDKQSLEKTARDQSGKSEAANLRSQLAEARTSVDSLQKETKRLESKLAEAKASPAAPSKQSEEELKAARKTIQSQQTQIAALEKDKESLAKRAKDQPGKVEMDNVRLQLAEARASIESLRRENKKMETLLTDDSVVPSLQLKKTQEELNSAKKAAQTQEAKVAGLLREKDALEKGNKDLEAKLKQAQSKEPSTESAKMKELQRQLDTTSQQMAALKKTSQATESELAALRKKDEILEKANKELENQVKRAGSDNKHNAGDLTKITGLEQERDDLQKKLSAAVKDSNDRKAKSDATKIAQLSEQLAGLRARVESYEAKKIPYTAEERAVLKTAALTPPVAESKMPKKSSKDLPASARPLVADAQKAFEAHRYDDAEKKYLEVLRVDDKNPSVLANLAAIHVEQNRLEEAEVDARNALKIDANDGFAMSVLGLIKYKQNKPDEALDLLSRAAKEEPKNAVIQNHLGIVLNEKGQRGPAEIAFRKAVQLAPTYAEAHHNLALFLATQQPPSLELARWHYQKALANGHPKNAELEKILGSGN